MSDEAMNKENKGGMRSNSAERATQARIRRDALQKKRLDELHAQLASEKAAQEKRESELRQRQAELRQKDENRRLQAMERKRALDEELKNWRDAIRERDRERMERAKQRTAKSTSTHRQEYAFGSSTPRLLMPMDTSGINWSTRRAMSTTNVTTASAPLTRPQSALQLNVEDPDDTKLHPFLPYRSSVARRRTDLVPTIVAPKSPGRVYSMTRLDRIGGQRALHSASPSLHHLNRTQYRSPPSGDNTPSSRPGSAMSGSTVRRTHSNPRKPRPVSVAITGVNTPTDAATELFDNALGNKPKDIAKQVTTQLDIGIEKQPPVQTISSQHGTEQLNHEINNEISEKETAPLVTANLEDVIENRESVNVQSVQPVTLPQDETKTRNTANETLESGTAHPIIDLTVEEPKATSENRDIVFNEDEQKTQNEKLEVSKNQTKFKTRSNVFEVPKPAPKDNEENVNNCKDANSTTRRINTVEEAKAALAEKRRMAKEKREREAELERQRVQREAEEEEERQRREEDEARELAEHARKITEQKLQMAIEAQQLQAIQESERKAREEAEKQARIKEEEEKRRAAKEAERQRKEESEREERERLARKQRVDEIMQRTGVMTRKAFRAQAAAISALENGTQQAMQVLEVQQERVDETDSNAVNGDQVVVEVKNEKEGGVTDPDVPIATDGNRSISKRHQQRNRQALAAEKSALENGTQQAMQVLEVQQERVDETDSNAVNGDQVVVEVKNEKEGGVTDPDVPIATDGNRSISKRHQQRNRQIEVKNEEEGGVTDPDVPIATDGNRSISKRHQQRDRQLQLDQEEVMRRLLSKATDEDGNELPPGPVVPMRADGLHYITIAGRQVRSPQPRNTKVKLNYESSNCATTE